MLEVLTIRSSISFLVTIFFLLLLISKNISLIMGNCSNCLQTKLDLVSPLSLTSFSPLSVSLYLWPSVVSTKPNNSGVDGNMSSVD